MMHDTYKSCQGCPDRAPGCHGRCEGYKYRSEEGRRRNRERKEQCTWVNHEVFDKRLSRLYNEKYRRKG